MNPIKIENTERRFGEANHYMQLGKYVFTTDELERAKHRYDRNPEDVRPTPSEYNYTLIGVLLFIIAVLLAILLASYPAIVSALS